MNESKRGDAGEGVVDRIARLLAARESTAITPSETVHWAAVAILLRERRPGEVEILFIRRSERAGDPWSGHIAFPGGRSAPEDVSLEETAAREALEEVGIDVRRSGRLLGVLDDLHPRTRIVPPVAVRPFVWSVSSDVEPAPPSESEVAAVFWAPLARLRAPESAAEHVFERDGAELRAPAVRHEEHVIWGMTERLLRQLLAVAEHNA